MSVTIDYDDSAIVYSPYTWGDTGSAMKTICCGAYFKTLFSGTSCALTFDMTSLDAAPAYPEILYSVDGEPWIKATIAASVSLTMNSAVDNAKVDWHTLEVIYKNGQATDTPDMWGTDGSCLKFTGLTLDDGADITAPVKRDKNIICFGDSITKGTKVVDSDGANENANNDASLSWVRPMALALNAEYGQVGFGSSGYQATGAGNIPTFPNHWNYLWSGESRVFTPDPDFIIINHGTNDSTVDITSAAQSVFEAILAATTNTIIIVAPPFPVAYNTNQKTNLENAVTAVNSSRCLYLNTTNMIYTDEITTNAAVTTDNTHPSVFANTHILAPNLSNALMSLYHTNRMPITIGVG